jgi:hypothetical protein
MYCVSFFSDANKQAKKDLEATLKRHAIERQSLSDEREIIKMIMRYIGVLHDVKATEKSFAAGGRDSVKDPETGKSCEGMPETRSAPNEETLSRM